MTCKGNWYGMDLSKELSSSGVMKASLAKKRAFCGHDVNFKLDYVTQEGGSWGGDLNFSVATSLNDKRLFGISSDFNYKNTLKFAIMKEKVKMGEVEQFEFNGIDNEIAYNNGDKNLGAFLKLGAFEKEGKFNMK